MKKKLLALLLATTMSMALIACGGSKEEAATKEVAVEEEAVEAEEEAAEEVAGDYTEEQSAFVDEFNTMVDDYNVVIDAINATPELAENQELADMMNEVTACIDEAAEIISDPANLTAEIMDSYRIAFGETYKIIEQVSALVDETGATAETSEEKEALKALFTSALAGADEAENTYWFLFNDDLTLGACVILSADYTQSVNVLGTVSADGDAMVITNEETGDFVKFTVTEEGEDYLVVAFEEGNEVTIINADLDEVIDTVLAIDETTEILN
mgnify:CR=1 FL=1